MKKLILLFTLVLIGCSYSLSNDSARSEFSSRSVVQFINHAQRGEIDKMQSHVDLGFDLNQQGKNGLTPLYWLMAYGDKTIEAKAGFKFMLENGADVMLFETILDQTALHYAAMMDDSDYLRMILKYSDYDIDMVRPGNSWNTPLLKSIFYDRYENSQLLIKYGANLGKKTPRGWTPLRMAAGIDWQAAYILLENGSPFLDLEKENQTLIDWEIENMRWWPHVHTKNSKTDHRQKVIDFLRDEGVTVDPWMPDGWLEVHSEAPPEPEREQLELEINTYPDADVYKIGPDDEGYALEVLDIYNPAVANVTHQVRGKVIDTITVEISGDRQERLSTYNFERGRLTNVRKQTKIYQFPKWDDKHAPEVFTEELVEATFIGNDIRLVSLIWDGEKVDCSETDLCDTESAKIFHDIGVYEQLRFLEK